MKERRQGLRQQHWHHDTQHHRSQAAAPDQGGHGVVHGNAAGGHELRGKRAGCEQAPEHAHGVQAGVRPDDDQHAQKADSSRYPARNPRRLLQQPGRQRKHNERRKKVDGRGLGLGKIAQRLEEEHGGQQHDRAPQQLCSRP